MYSSAEAKNEHNKTKMPRLRKKYRYLYGLQVATKGIINLRGQV